MLDITDKTYNIDKKIDYFTVRSTVIRSLKIVREGLNRHIASINLHKIIDGMQEDEGDIIIANTTNNLFDCQDDNTKLSSPLLKAENKKYNRISKLAYCNLKV
jgi:hypothetical protein